MDRRTRMFLECRGCFRNLVVVVLSVQALFPVRCEVVLVPPTQVRVNGSQLTWTPGSEESGVTYTAEYRRWESDRWNVEPDCRRTPLTSCDPGSVRSLSRPGYDCVQLRVRAERVGSKSEPVQACSSRGDLCSPQVQLSAGPGSLTVRLNRDHSLILDHAAHVQYRVSFGAEGEDLKEHLDSHSSTMIPNLEVGRRYCVQVQFTLHGTAVGPASCAQCETVPPSSGPTQTVAVTAVLVVVPVLLAVGLFYVLIYKHKKIKEVLRPPFSIPEFFQEPLDLLILRSPTEENFDPVCSLTPIQVKGDQNLLQENCEVLLLQENSEGRRSQKLLTLNGSDLSCT